ncbi:hypothetical protein Tco_0500317 [Tanacetum coccineum]
MTGNLSSPSKNAYSRWDGKSLSPRSGGSLHEDLIFSGTLISQTGNGGRFGSLLITLNNSPQGKQYLLRNIDAVNTRWVLNHHDSRNSSISSIRKSLPLKGVKDGERESITRSKVEVGLPLSEISSHGLDIHVLMGQFVHREHQSSRAILKKFFLRLGLDTPGAGGTEAWQHRMKPLGGRAQYSTLWKQALLRDYELLDCS